MDIQTISIVTAFIGVGIATVWDLKTTEVPDQLPYIMIAIALILFGYQSFVEWSYKPILYSVGVGLGFLAFGYVMYYFGQWGGADAWILSAVGFLLPFRGVNTTFPLPVIFIFNLFFVGAVYMIIYAFIFSLFKRRIFSQFSRDLKASSRIALIGLAVLFAIFMIVGWYMSSTFLHTVNLSRMVVNSLFSLGVVAMLFVIWKFAKAVEEYGFKRKIPVSKLKVGDMLLDEKKLVGITEEQLKKIKRSGKREVWIKEGVRFAMAFPLALIVTLLFGDGIFLLMKFLFIF